VGVTVIGTEPLHVLTITYLCKDGAIGQAWPLLVRDPEHGLCEQSIWQMQLEKNGYAAQRLKAAPLTS
jgi:hypothetical protein